MGLEHSGYQPFICGLNVTGLPTKFLDYAPGYHVFGGIPLQGDHTLDECLAGCDKDLSCDAVDYNADKTCWFHNKTTSCNALSIKPYCTHYTTLTCGKIRTHTHTQTHTHTDSNIHTHPLHHAHVW